MRIFIQMNSIPFLVSVIVSDFYYQQATESMVMIHWCLDYDGVHDTEITKGYMIL